MPINIILFCNMKFVSVCIKQSFTIFILYVIGKNGLIAWNPLSINGTGNVPPDDANCKISIINAKNFPMSPKFFIKNWIILMYVTLINAHSR